MCIIIDVTQVRNPLNTECPKDLYWDPYFLFSIAFFYIFADDTSVFLIGKEYTQLIVSLNKELKKVSHWLNANGLTINVKKDSLYGVSPSQNKG